MPDVREIQSLDSPELQPYRTLRRPQEHRDAGIFVAEGGKVVARMLAAGIEVVSLLMTPDWLERIRPQGAFPVFVAPQPLLESIVGFPLHQGVMGIGRIPPQPDLEQLLQQAPQPQLFLALDGLVHAENVGVVVRNAAAFGVQAIFHDSTSSSPYLRRAVRNSMGTVFKLPAIEVPDLPALLQTLTHRGITTIAADPSGAAGILDSTLTRSICLVLGNEGSGISPRVLQACSQRVAIPMQNDTDSLNVGSASAVFLYEVLRQRTRD